MEKHINNGIFFNDKKEGNPAIYNSHEWNLRALLSEMKKLENIHKKKNLRAFIK